MSKSFPIWDHFFPLFFPNDSEDLKSLDFKKWGQKTFKQSEQIVKNIFATTILHSLREKDFKSETTSFHYFSQRIPKIKKVWTLDFEKWGQKNVKTEWTNKEEKIKEK